MTDDIDRLIFFGSPGWQNELDEEAYASLADELNDGDVEWREDDWEPEEVARALRYAERHELPWPPGKGDFDRYLEDLA